MTHRWRIVVNWERDLYALEMERERWARSLLMRKVIMTTR